MFELQCMEYLKGLEQDPQNIQLRNQFSQLLHQNKEKIDSFIQQFQLSSQQKQLLMEVMQESLSQNSNQFDSEMQENISKNGNKRDISGDNNFQNSAFYDITIENFKEWRDEYFKLRSVSPKCIEIAEHFIQSNMMDNNQYLQDAIDTFESLPTQQNDAFLKFKNHVRNIIIANLIETLNQEITIVKTSSLSFFKKYKLLFEIEKIQRRVAKQKIDISKFDNILIKSKNIRGN